MATLKIIRKKVSLHNCIFTLKETDSKSSFLASMFTGMKPLGGTSYTMVTGPGGGGFVVVEVKLFSNGCRRTIELVRK